MISIIIVTWNCEHFIENCINSIIKHVNNYEIIIVDNNSSDKTCEIVKSIKNEEIKLVELKDNIGFSKGNNIGVQYSKYENIVLLNPDTILLSDGLNDLVKELDDSVGLIGCKLLNEDRTLQPSCYMFDTPVNIFNEQFQIGRLLPSKLKNKYSPYLGEHEKKQSVDWVVGAFMLMKRSFFIEINGFSEDYFLYAEDMDLCYKVKLAGKKVIFTPNYKIIHLGGQSEKSDNNTTNKFKKMLDSRQKFSEKYNFKKNMSTFLFSYRFKYFITMVLNILTINKSKLIISKKTKYYNYVEYIKEIIKS